MGVLFGLVLALIIHNTLLFRIESNNLIYIILVVIGAGCGVAGLFLRSYVTILSSSFCGAYMIIRPFGWFVGSFPNEFTLVKEIKYGLLEEVPQIYYLYVMLVLLLTGIGAKF